jgi:tetratricopeptide (TPR) repeat protein
MEIKVLELRRGVLGDSHPDTIGSMASLAAIYHVQGRYDEAEKMEIKVLELRRGVIGEEHPDMIDSRTLAEDHPDRLASQHALARTYEANGQVKEAIALLEQVVVIEARTLAEDYPDGLAS